jgi:hypothetical protein
VLHTCAMPLGVEDIVGVVLDPLALGAIAGSVDAFRFERLSPGGSCRASARGAASASVLSRSAIEAHTARGMVVRSGAPPPAVRATCHAAPGWRGDGKC